MLRQVFKCLFRISSKDFGCRLFLLFMANRRCSIEGKNGWGIHELGHREKRFVPYALTIISYVTCLITMYKIHLPRYMSGIIVAALICMILCTLINFKWKISTHVASSGMMVGGLLSYSFIFNFNPVWWLCFFILLSGMLGTARIIVKQHTLLEVLAGFIVGLFCGVIGILFI
jgi:membrane-associated phospholipid phosphatase